MGVIVSLASLAIFGSDNFLIPAMAGILAMLTLFRKQFDEAGSEVKKKTEEPQGEETASGGDQE